MNLPVPNKVWPLGEGFPTLAALVRLFSRVNFLVLNEFRDAAKGLPTSAALIITTMNSPVYIKVGALAKAFSTFTALIRPFPSVSSLVQDQRVFAVELFSTFVAYVRPCSCVNFLVSNEIRLAAKEFSTITALIEPLTCVNAPVFNKARDLPKELPTFIALIRPFTSVYCLVFEKVTALAKEFPTFAALIGPFSSVNSLMPSKCVFSGEYFPTFTTLVMLLSSAKSFPKLSVLMGLYPAVRDPVVKARGGWQVHSALTVYAGLVWHRGSAAFHGIPALIRPEEFLSTLLLLVPVKVCTEP
uniref:Uncharacterized protein n=1 Tax=Sus scrofa TaxID=9823 RepID=A0A8D0U6N9_PIG